LKKKKDRAEFLSDDHSQNLNRRKKVRQSACAYVSIHQKKKKREAEIPHLMSWLIPITHYSLFYQGTKTGNLIKKKNTTTPTTNDKEGALNRAIA